MLSWQKFTESVYSYSLLIRSTVPRQIQETSFWAVKWLCFWR